MINDDKKPIYVAVNDSDICVGYAFVSYRNRRFKKRLQASDSVI